MKYTERVLRFFNQFPLHSLALLSCPAPEDEVLFPLGFYSPPSTLQEGESGFPACYRSQH
jgi:hypothetical protein